MNIYSLTSLVAAVFCILSGAFVFLRRGHDKKCRFFAISSVVTGIWTSFPFLTSIAANETEALFFARLIYVAAVFDAPLWLGFVYALTEEEWTRQHRTIFIFLLALCGGFLVFLGSPHFIKGVVRFAPYFSLVVGKMFIPFLAVFSGIFVYMNLLLLQAFRRSSGYRKNQLKIILFSCLFGFLAAMLHFGSGIFRREPIPHDIFVIAHTGLIAYAIMKYRLMDIKIAFTRTGIFLAVYILVLGIPFTVAMRMRTFLEGFLGADWWLVPSGILGLCATVGPFVYIFLERQAEKRLFREQILYQETLRQAAREMARIHNLKKLLSLIVHTLTKTAGISYAAIYLSAEKEPGLSLQIVRGNAPSLPAVIEETHPFLEWIRRHPEAMVYEDILSWGEREHSLLLEQITNKMKDTNVAVIVPGFLDKRLIGLLILGPKRSGQVYTRDDINTFALLANQAALAVENALLYEGIERKVKERTEELVAVQKQLVQAEKLATVGTLAGGVAHEINNPLTAILTNVQMLLALNENLDADSRESLQLIEEATRRCRDIVQKLMEYARRPLQTQEMMIIDLALVIRKVVDFLAYQLKQDNIMVEVRQDGSVFLVKASQGEIEQVLTNIILNAKDAILQKRKTDPRQTGNILIHLTKNAGEVIVSIRDNGIGISQDILPKIFDPFFTTKDVGKGMGLGLSISQSIINKHNGTIGVDSLAGQGATFFIRLPRAG